MSIVEFKNVSFSYKEGGYTIKDLSFTIGKGEFAVFIGRNGSGKSTTAKLINCLLTPTSGEIYVDGMDVKDKSKKFEIRKSAGMVFQNPDNQSVATIVEDDIAFGPENLGIERDEIAKRIEFALSATETTEFRDKSISRLSGGQKQRVAIAGVLAIKPKILILDESTSMLDPKGRKEVLSVIEKLRKEEGMTVILITHYMEETVNADKVFVMANGELQKVGTPQEIFSDSELIERAGLSYPRATIIAQKLVNAGVKLEKPVLTEEDLRGELCRLLLKG